MAWVLIGTCALLLVADRGARSWAAEHETGLLRFGDVWVDGTNNGDLATVVAGIPAPAAPRVLVLGSSQIATVKRLADGGRDAAIPHKLQRALEKRGLHSEVVDLSAGGQQIAESLVVGDLALSQVRPQVVVLGVGLFSMRKTLVRPRLAAVATGDAIARAVAQDPLRAKSLREVTDSLSGGRQEREPSIQERIDRRISAFLQRHSSLVRHRQQISDALIDRPLRRDLVALLRGRGGVAPTEHHFGISDAYGPSLDAIVVLARMCREVDADLLVAVLPYESTRDSPYSVDDADRLSSDLLALSRSEHFGFLDLRTLLPVESYSELSDGTPDSLHYDEAGHAEVGRALAEAIIASGGGI